MPSHRKSREDSTAIANRIVGRRLMDAIRALLVGRVVTVAAGAATCAAPDDSGEG